MIIHMNIDAYLKKGFDPVIELDDEVEYLLTVDAINLLKKGAKFVKLIRLIDSKEINTEVIRISAALEKEGPIDYLKYRQPTAR